MKNILVVWFLILKLFVYDISCYQGSITTKFHQYGYKIKDIQLQAVSYNEKYFNFCDIEIFHYNSTFCAVNATINMKVGVEDKMEVKVRGYRFFKNEYRSFPAYMQMNLKSSFDTNAIGMDITSCGNLTCHFEKDITYHACNVVIDETRFPPHMPNGKYKLDISLLYLDEEIAHLSIFAQIYTPVLESKN